MLLGVEIGPYVDNLVQIGVVAAAVVAAWRTAKQSTSKQIAEAQKDLTDTALDLVEPLKKRISFLESEVQSVKASLEVATRQLDEAKIALAVERAERAKDRRRLTLVEKWAKALVHQVVELGGEPIPFEDMT